MVMAYVVVVPSYKRADILKEKTLRMLSEGGVPMKKVHVFVANAAEAAEYEKVVGGLGVKIVVGVLGITRQRAFIREYFPGGTRIVSIDDDVEQLMELDASGKKLVPFAPGRAKVFFAEAFKEAKQRGCGLWGVFPTPNPFYMVGQTDVSTSLKFVIGTVHGFVNGKKGDIVLGDIEEKEDVEMTILYWQRDGGVLRYNHISFKTRFKNSNGGLGGLQGRIAANKKAAEYLADKYPCCTRIKIRKNGMYEIVLRVRRVQG